MKKLRKRLHKLHVAIRRRQAIRKKALDAEKAARKRGLKAIAKVFERVAKQLHDRIQKDHAQARGIEQKIEDAKDDRGGREAFVSWVKGEVGVTEGSARHLEYIAIVGKGGSSSWPWCSEFCAAGLVEKGGIDRDELPANPWYSGAWLTWSGGHRVSYSDAIPGDLIIYDWGDGGMTDHVEVYVGNGQGIGGNESHPSGGAVNGPNAVSVGNVVGVVRVNW